MILLGSTNPPQSIDLITEIGSAEASNPACDTTPSHTGHTEAHPKPWNRSSDGREGCSTRVSHSRRPTGLWLRGAVWQFRTRVPVELRSRLGRTHLNRSLGTSSYPDAIRMARKVAFDIERIFDEARGDVGNDVCHAVDSGAVPPCASSATVMVDTALPGISAPIQINLDALADRIVALVESKRDRGMLLCRRQADPRMVEVQGSRCPQC
jgi:hypothetical protein